MNIKKGDYVVVEYPNSCFRLGGHVIGVITPMGKDPEFVVGFVSGIGHSTFPLSSIINHRSV